MITHKNKFGRIVVGAIFFTTFSFTAISYAASENSEENGLSVMKRDQAGRVSEQEFMQHHQWMFEQNDTNQDGFLDIDEMKNLHKMVKKMHERFELQN